MFVIKIKRTISNKKKKFLVVGVYKIYYVVIKTMKYMLIYKYKVIHWVKIIF